ncbi:MAG: hypothetical protein IJ736_12740, partial [Firmicutes bacterium]|nr:hypothetical protein [Bacillota bacterium]
RNEDFKSEILEQIAKGNDYLSIREVLVKYRDSGINKEDMLEMLDDMRKNSDTEDMILDLMDMASGFCRRELDVY